MVVKHINKKLLTVVLLLLFLGSSTTVFASCAAQDMEGYWRNTDSSGHLKRIKIKFPCYGTSPSPSGPDALVRAFGPCEGDTCNWGEVAAHYTFIETASGFPQFTRVEARFEDTDKKKELVILRLGSDELLVFWSVDFQKSSEDKDFSFVEHFKRQKCVTTFLGQVMCEEERVRYLGE